MAIFQRHWTGKEMNLLNILYYLWKRGENRRRSYNISADKIGKVSFVKCNLWSGWKSKHSCVVIPTHLWTDIDFSTDSKVVDY